jgi:hypothetical protein
LVVRQQLIGLQIVEVAAGLLQLGEDPRELQALLKEVSPHD